MAAISFRNVSKCYGKGPKAVEIIAGFSADIADGEFIVVLGPSGCGKSTVLRMVAGLEEVSSGEIAIADKVVNRLAPSARDIAMVFQNYALYPHMSVFDNMAYGLKIAGLPKAEIKARVDKAAGILELSELLVRKPHELSGGQRQRVAMGRAIVRAPKVFLFDEPLSNLDARLRIQTRLEIQKLHRELRITSLFVTHDQAEALTLADRVLVLNGGQIEHFATPHEIYHAPASTFVANFIGSPPMNLLRAAPGLGDGLILGVRPEHMALSFSGWGITVVSVEMLGSEKLIHGQMGPEAIVVKIDESVPTPEPGQTIFAVPRANKLHYFDAQTGRRTEA